MIDETQNQQFGLGVIGMAGRFPGANSCEVFWSNLRDSVETISYFSVEELAAEGVSTELLSNPNYVRAKGLLDSIDLFDASLFGFTPREAELMDPQHRLFLQCAWEALEDAGYDAKTYEGAIGVYASQSPNSYLISNLLSRPDILSSSGTLQVSIANGVGHLATNVSYRMGLRGPSIAVQTACSSSLVAVHLACQGLLAGDCDIALAGGVSINLPQKRGYLYEEGGTHSPDGHCRPFDAKAKGMVTGEGLGVVVLKRMTEALEDGDEVRAVVRGSAVNNDGSSKVGYTAPSVKGQAAVIEEAMAVSSVLPASIGFVEAHGTATALGDVIEMEALTQAFEGVAQGQSCAVGSVKANIGHLDAAAGIAGLIKTVLALEQKTIPPSIHFVSPNPDIDFAQSAFFVNTTALEWANPTLPRRAGVSSFGIGGTNAHVILEEAPQQSVGSASRDCQLLVLSAASAEALERTTDRFVAHLDSSPPVDLADVAFTLQTGRRALKYRRAVVCKSQEDGCGALGRRDRRRLLEAAQEASDRPVAFLFPGQGTQYAGMGCDLYERDATFKQSIDRCADVLEPHLETDIRECMFERDTHYKLDETWLTQPVLFAFEYALAQLWISWGLRPSAMIGHSIGEYVAACLAGVFSLEDTLHLVAERGRMIQSLPPGGMLAVQLSERDVAPLLDDDLSIASVNSPSASVVAGPRKRLEDLEHKLLGRLVKCQQLRTSHAFHSPMMTPAQVELERRVASVERHAPQIPYLSNVSGTWATSTDATDADYWARHLCSTVRLSDGLSTLLDDDNRVLLEVGPGSTLSVLARQNGTSLGKDDVITSLPDAQDSDEQVSLLHALGQLWAAGVTVRWADFYSAESRRRKPLTSYPFDATRYWIEPGDTWVGKATTQPSTSSHSSHSPTNSVTLGDVDSQQTAEAIATIMQQLLGVPQVGLHDDFFHLGGSSLTAVQLITQIRDTFGAPIALRDFFSSPSPAALARAVMGSSSASTYGDAARIYREVSCLSAGEVRARLAEPHTVGFKPIEFSIFFFSSDAADGKSDKYRLVLDATRFADDKGFAAVWVPERHFHSIVGLFPNTGHSDRTNLHSRRQRCASLASSDSYRGRLVGYR
jgi:phthiocerol/phenolphthiocerol synthesis type-I polyketide synthase E